MIDFQLVVDWLTYKSYENNRNMNPEISSDRWCLIYKQAEVFEKIYRKNLNLMKEKLECLN